MYTYYTYYIFCVLTKEEVFDRQRLLKANGKNLGMRCHKISKHRFTENNIDKDLRGNKHALIA